LRIAFVSDAAYPWNIGGIENLEHSEALELAKSHDVHFFSMRWPGMKKEFKKNGITYHTHHDVNTKKFYRHGRRSIREAIVFSVGIFRIFGHRFDIIISNEFPVLQIPVLELYCKLTGCKLILDTVEVWDKKYWTTYLGNFPGELANIYSSFFLKFADAYIARSSIAAESLKSIGIKSERIRVFAPVLDDDVLKTRIDKKPKERKVVFFGRLIKEKRIDKWLHIIKEASKKVNVVAAIYGDGPEKQSIEQGINDMNLGKRVKLRPFAKSNKFVREEMMRSSLFLQMSEREGLSMVVLESLAVGTPVVLPKYSPIPDEVKRMCVVLEEKQIPKKVVEILKSDDKSRFINNKEEISSFLKSNINSFYSDLFRYLLK
jgi:L-malate glycosyltransferase